MLIASLPDDYVAMEINIPEGYAAVPVFEEEPHSALWIGVLVARQPSVETGAFVRLRDTLDARVYLGCVMDAGGHVHQWIEVWIQTVAGLKGSPAMTGGALSNRILDERWRNAADTLQKQDRDAGIFTGAESHHPLPLFVRTQSLSPYFPHTPTGVPWRLCEDDALLEQNGLPAYRIGLDRYWVADGSDGKPCFVAVTPDAPTSRATVPLETAVSEEGVIPLNPEGGLVMIRPYYALGFDEYLDVLGGRGWAGVARGREILDPYGLTKVVGSSQEPNRMFLEASNAPGRLCENLYLKLGLLADAMKAVEAFVRGTRRPLLNLDENAFRVHLAPQGSALPSLWTARMELVGTGDALELPLEATEARYFVRGRGPDLSIYRPQSAGLASVGRCGIRIRQTLPETRKGTAIEGTFQTRDLLAVGASDLVWLRLPLPTGAVDLYANLEETGASTRGEWRFRTLEQKFDAQRAGSLKALAGIPMQNVSYEVLPLQSTPCDLYALAVLAVRMLLVGEGNALPVALDSLLSLAREAECAEAKDETLSTVIAAAFARDPQWCASLGPQYLSDKEMGSETAFQSVPPNLWWDTLAMIVRMLPGQGAFRTCRHLGDASDGALQDVLRRCRTDVACIAARTRGLIVGDPARNRELRDIVNACRRKIG